MKKTFLMIFIIVFTGSIVSCTNNKKIDIVVETTPKIIPQTATEIFKNKQFGDFEQAHNNKSLRKMFENTYKGTECGSFGEQECLSDINFGDNQKFSHAGLILPDKSVMLFHYDKNDKSGPTGNERGYGKVYYDLNGNEAPNNICEDRYVYNIYAGRISVDIMMPCLNSDEPMPFLE